MRTLRRFIAETRQEDRYYLAAHHTSGAKKFDTSAPRAHHVHRHLEALRGYSRDRGEDYNVSVTNRHTGEVHGVQIRRGEYKNGKKPVIEDAVAANAMGSSSSVAGTGAIDTFDPVLGRRTRKRRGR